MATTTTTTLVGFGFTEPSLTPDTTTFAANFAKLSDTISKIDNAIENSLAPSIRDIADNTQNIGLQLEDLKGGIGHVITGITNLEDKLCELHEIRHSIDELNTTIYKFCKLLTHPLMPTCK